MALQRVTNRSPYTVCVNGRWLQHGESTYVDDADQPDLICNEGVVQARVIEWPDETIEVVINAAGG